MTTLDFLCERIDGLIEAVRGEALTADLERIYNRRMANDQSFTVMIFGMAEVQHLHSDCRLLMQMVGAHDLPLTDVKKVTEGMLTSHENILRKRYEMTEAADVVRDTKAALLASDDKDAWNRLLTQVFLYTNNVGHALAVLIPWHELAVAFEGARTVNAGHARCLVR